MKVSTPPSPSVAPAPTRGEKLQTTLQTLGVNEQEAARQGALRNLSTASSFESPAQGQGRLTGGALPQVPSDPYQYALMAMDVGRAAKTLLQHYDAVERVGMNGRGRGSGDANIGSQELARVAEGSHNLPADVRAAARWMLDHPTATRSIDQGAGHARGDAREYHFSRQDLQSFVAALPAQSAASESRSPAYAAARVLREHYDFVEGVGMDATGRGARDANIGMSELRRVADPKSGAPAEVQAAAQWLIANPGTLNAIDSSAGRSHGVANEVHLSKADLDAFLATEPPRVSNANSMLVETIQTSGTENRDPTHLTDTQRQMLLAAGYKEGSDEWKQGRLKFQIQNLTQAINSAGEFGQTYSELRKKSTDGTSR